MHLHLGLSDITEGKRIFFVKTLWKMLTPDLRLWQNIWELARLREDKVVLSVLQLCMHRMCPINTRLVHRTRRPRVKTLQVSARAHWCLVCSGRASPVVTGCVRCCTEQLHCPFFSRQHVNWGFGPSHSPDLSGERRTGHRTRYSIQRLVS